MEIKKKPLGKVNKIDKGYKITQETIWVAPLIMILMFDVWCYPC